MWNASGNESINIGCSFKFILNEEQLQSKNTNNAKSEVGFKQLIRDLQSVVRS
jgi:hypothetical protein